MDDSASTEQCIVQPRSKLLANQRLTKTAQPINGFINFESAHVHPIDLTPDGKLLLAVNTANHTLEVFDVSNGNLTAKRTIAVGIDPISVRVRSNSEAWVVNKISDSVSIVDLSSLAVTRTLDTDNEPSDIVFAANGNKAFVSCAEPNRVLVYTLANLSSAPSRISLLAENPRAMAVSADGSKVFVAAFESGNATTSLNGRFGPISTGVELGSDNVVSQSSSPYGGVNPAPNNGTIFSPPKNSALPNQIASMIVRKRADSRWTDDNGRDWSAFVSGAQAANTRRVAGWDLPDRDVAIIDAQTESVSYQRGLMNIVMAMAVNPSNGEVTVVGTDARNEVRYEPNLNGTFLRVNRATFVPGAAATIGDLNPHLDYSVRSIAAAARAQSIGDPRGIKWNTGGTRAFVTGMGSNNLIVMAANGQRLGRVAVGQGPTGIALHDAASRAYVLNKFDASISIIDTQNLTETSRISFFDPTPVAIKAGRPFLYDTQRGSGLGHIACASCHVDARLDRLAWDLGDPAGSMNGVHHPMKGPMMTQTLQDIMRFPNLHWRGDRSSLTAFNPAYVSLMSADAQLTSNEMTAFGNFLSTIHFEPNPYRNLDNSLPTSLLLPNGATADAVAGRSSLAACLPCHLASQTRTNSTNAELSQNVIPPSFHSLYQRIGYWNQSTNNSTSGFGFFHDGVDPLLTATRSNGALAAIMTFDGPDNGLVTSEARQDTHAAVGKQVSILGAATTAQSNALTRNIGFADSSPHVAMIASATINNQRRAWVYAGSNRFLSPKNGNAVSSRADLESMALNGSAISFTLVVKGTETTIATNLDSLIQTNRPPSVTNPGTQNTGERSVVSLQINASDPDGDAMTYSAIGLPVAMAIDPATGLIGGTPLQVGSFAIVVTVTDAKGSASSVSFTWNVSQTQFVWGMVAPTPGGQIATTSVNFAWNMPGATATTLLIGSWPGANDIGSANAGTANSVTIANLPLDGRTVYARVVAQMNGVTVVRDAVYETRAPWGDGGIARLLTPAPASALAAGLVSFTWTQVGGAQYALYVGSGIGWQDMFGANVAATTASTISQSVSIPSNNGQPIYVRLWTQNIAGWWAARDYQLVGPP